LYTNDAYCNLRKCFLFSQYISIKSYFLFQVVIQHVLWYNFILTVFFFIEWHTQLMFEYIIFCSKTILPTLIWRITRNEDMRFFSSSLRTSHIYDALSLTNKLWLYIFCCLSFFTCSTWNYFCSDNFLDLTESMKKKKSQKKELPFLPWYIQKKKKKKSYRKVLPVGKASFLLNVRSEPCVSNFSIITIFIEIKSISFENRLVLNGMKKLKEFNMFFIV
jgi:hypothetical protein